MNCVAWSVGQQGEKVFIADGWGQRDWKNSDIGATIPYIVRRCEGEGEKTFKSVFEGYENDEPFVRNIKLIDKKGIVEVETIIGTDYIVSMPGSGVLKIGKGKNSISLSGHFAAASVQNQRVVWSHIISEKWSNKNTSYENEQLLFFFSACYLFVIYRRLYKIF